MKIKVNQLILSVILLITGFIISFSFQLTNEQGNERINNEEWERRDQLLTTVLQLQSSNKELRKELEEIQLEVQKRENMIADQEETTSNLVEELNRLRLITGKVKVTGPGVTVTLSDSSYIPEEHNPNDYIVHEEHIRNVINEMLVSGAEAIAVNGQRITNHTPILCIGPVISVDGVEYNAPFEISAIGNPDTIEKSLTLTDNTVDQLVNEGIDVRVEKKQEIVLDPTLQVEG